MTSNYNYWTYVNRFTIDNIRAKSQLIVNQNLKINCNQPKNRLLFCCFI